MHGNKICDLLVSISYLEIRLFLAAAGCRMAGHKLNEGITEELALIDTSTTIKNVINVWKESLKPESLIHSVLVIITFNKTYP
jgi:hypothetical protein